MTAIDLYALLGVARDATTDEVRTAWKLAVADLDPTDPSLNVFNQAGAVLLDAERRAAYDAELAAAEEPGEPAGPEETTPLDEPGAPAATEPVATAPSTDAVAAPADAKPAAGPSVLLLAALSVLTLATILAAIFLSGPLGRSLPDRGVPAEEQRLADAVTAAEKAAVPVLSYDYRHLAEDKEAAASRMTDDFREDYEQTFTLIEQNAPAAEAVVTAEVLASAIAGRSGDTVEVLLFVNRPTSKKGAAQPEVYRDQVTFSMRRVGGEWLVDDMRTKRPA